jgi:hypothetical protein
VTALQHYYRVCQTFLTARDNAIHSSSCGINLFASASDVVVKVNSRHAGGDRGISGVSKYRPLKDYLLDQTKARLELTLVEIEEIIGQELPPSAYAPRWWITGRTIQQRPVWQNAWREAGYHAALLPGADRVQFRKAP